MLSRFGFEKKAVAVFLSGLLALGGVVSLGQGANASTPPYCTPGNITLPAGTGDDAGKYVISTQEELMHFSLSNTLYRTSSIVVRSDIDVSLCQWVPASGVNSSSDFRGVFDGGGHVVTFQIINRVGNDSAFFASVIGAQIKNLTLKGRVDGEGDFIASLATYIEQVTITNVRSEVDVLGRKNGLSQIGGNYVAGLVAYVFDSTIQDSFFTGSVFGGGDYVGGLAGYVMSSSQIIDSSVSGDIEGSSRVGGVIGSSQRSAISSSSFVGNLDAMSSTAGGVAGELDRSQIIKSWTSGSVIAQSVQVGGLAGFASSSSVSESYSSATIQGQRFVGGLVGQFENYSGNASSSISDSYSIGEVRLVGTDLNGELGGLVGEIFADSNTFVRIRNSHFSGSILNLGATTGLSGLLLGEAQQVPSNISMSRTVSRVSNANSLGVSRESILVGSGAILSESISTRTTEQMHEQDFFKDTLGWDFASIWTMSTASSPFQGFPILQWQVIDSGSGGGSGGSGGSGSFAVLNPTVASSNLFANLQLRRAVTVSGANLNMVVSAEIDSKKALIDFRRSTASNLAISRLPLVPSGQYQLRLLGAAGQLVAEVPITIKAKFKNVRGFGSEAELSADLRKAMRQAARTYPAANSVRCWGVTTGNSASDLAAARQRAEAACEYLASRDPDLETEVRFRSGKGKPAANQAVRLRFFK